MIIEKWIFLSLFQVRNIFVHEEYNSSYFKNDIAMLVLNSSVQITAELRPVFMTYLRACCCRRHLRLRLRRRLRRRRRCCCCCCCLLVLCHRSFIPGTSLEPSVIPTAQASSFTLQYFPY